MLANFHARGDKRRHSGLSSETALAAPARKAETETDGKQCLMFLGFEDLYFRLDKNIPGPTLAWLIPRLTKDRRHLELDLPSG
jgi:hypothetical protein